ncbi:PREDICTED: LOW QUALITY PROTEIN: cuticle collagen 1-like, partial [Pygoscelis adeliae]
GPTGTPGTDGDRRGPPGLTGPTGSPGTEGIPGHGPAKGTRDPLGT